MDSIKKHILGASVAQKTPILGDKALCRPYPFGLLEVDVKSEGLDQRPSEPDID